MRQGIAFALLVLLVIFLFYSLRNFITSFLGAIIFYVLFKHFMQKLVYNRKWKKSLAAILIIFFSFLIVIVPLMGLSYILYSKISNVVTDPSSLLQGLHQLDAKVQSMAGKGFLNDENFQKVQSLLSNLIPNVLTQALQILSGIVMMYFILYYLLTSIDKSKEDLMLFSPFSRQNTQLFFTELKSMTVSNAIAVPLIAAAQGAVSGFGFWIFGLHEPFFWGVMCGCASIIPIIGSGLIWVPAGLFIVATGETWQGVGIFAYGILVISTMDNVFRFLFQKKFADVHPVITILGVIVGLQWFGLPGLVFGPLLISYFLLMLRIYKTEYLAK